MKKQFNTNYNKQFEKKKEPPVGVIDESLRGLSSNTIIIDDVVSDKTNMFDHNDAEILESIVTSYEVCNCQALTLRENPTKLGKILKILNKGTIISEGDLATDNWCEVVTLEGEQGWVMTDFIKRC